MEEEKEKFHDKIFKAANIFHLQMQLDELYAIRKSMGEDTPVEIKDWIIRTEKALDNWL